MKFGIYYAFWEKEWGGDFLPYIEKASKLGFDILEVACGNLDLVSDSYCKELAARSHDAEIMLTGGYGPRPEHDLSNPDISVVKNGIEFYKKIFPKMQKAGIKTLGGALYSYWPVSDASKRDKNGDLERSIKNMQVLADIAADNDITLNMESLNRFEGYLINTAEECVSYVQEVGKPNVKVMLDTFHMNIEEDSFMDAIRMSKGLLGHFHVGEPNRRPPFAGGRIPWLEIANALEEIGYDGDVVMEPFIRMGGQVGRDISIWRDLSSDADEAKMDDLARNSVMFLKKIFNR